MNHVKKALIVLFIVNIFVSGATASLFDWIYPKNTPQEKESFNDFYLKTVQPLNTKSNIELIGAYLTRYGASSVKVHVIDYNENFYVGKSVGATLLIPSEYSATFDLTSEQIKNIAGMLKDENIDLFEKIKINWILSKGLK